MDLQSMATRSLVSSTRMDWGSVWSLRYGLQQNIFVRIEIILVETIEPVSERGEVEDAELHLEHGGVLAVHDGDGGLGAGHVLGQPAAEHQAAVAVPRRHPLHLRGGYC